MGWMTPNGTGTGNEGMSAIQPEFSRKARVADLNAAAGRSISAKATAEERAALAKRFGAVAVPRCSFAAKIVPWRDGWRVTGVARARVTQTCVVSLAEIDQIVEERFERCYTPDPAPMAREEDIDPDADDPPELLGDSIDVGEIAAETVALALDPYPRAPDAAPLNLAAAPAGTDPIGEAEVRPFAALAALRDKMGSGNG